MIVLLDGPVGTELAARGVATPPPLWSAAAIDAAPDVLAAIHRDYAAAGATVLFSLHDLRVAHGLDHVVVLRERALRAFGTPADILTPELLLDVFAVRAHTVPGLTLDLP